MDRIELIDEILVKQKFKKGVEIGTFKGDYSREILKKWGGELYMVDVWSELGDEYVDGSNHRYHNKVYQDCINSISEFGNRAIMIRTSSETAHKLFQDESLDFVYIDANHAYDFVKKDIEYWYPKVKKGGFVMGHDYIKMDWYRDPNFDPNGKDKHIWTGDGTYYNGLFGVNPAVDEFCETNGYELSVTEEWFGTWYFTKK